IVDEAMMIEPTETESLETLDAFADAMLRLAEIAEKDPESLKELKHLRVIHLDETHAARNLNVRWVPPEELEDVRRHSDIIAANDSAHVEHSSPTSVGLKPRDEKSYEEGPTV
ncbi:MAG: hypothetical protein M3R04_02640, partial [bacterium]|nr:hypothetical protein [bacterium]